MTAPLWISRALDACSPIPTTGITDRVAESLLEHLPVEEIRRVIRKRIAGVAGITGDWIGAIAGSVTEGAVNVLAGDINHDVVTVTELYNKAAKALDAAGVPYAEDDRTPMMLQQRIAWLAARRPTILTLQRVEAERDTALSLVRSRSQSILALTEDCQAKIIALTTERDLARQLHANAERAFADCAAQRDALYAILSDPGDCSQ